MARKTASTNQSKRRRKAAPKALSKGSSRSRPRATKRTAAKATPKSSGARKKPAAKRAASKKATARKSTGGKGASRKAASPKGKTKASVKKAGAKGAARPASKSTAPRKPAARKSRAKAPVAKAPDRKPVAQAPPEKKATGRKAPEKNPETKPVGAKPARSRSRAPSKASAAAQSNGQQTMQREQGSLSDARAAASRLAAAAGLPTLRIRTLPGMEQASDEPRLAKSPLSKRELEKHRKILLAKRAQVAGDVTDMESEALGAGKDTLSSLPQHMADQGSDAYDQSLSLGLAASQRELLREIDAALDRIDKGTYGVCEALGRAINAERLEATPWTRYSFEGARMMDRGRGRS